MSARLGTDAVTGLNCFVSWQSNSLCLPCPRPRDQQKHNNSSILLIITVEFINYHRWLFSEQVTQQFCGLSNIILPLLVCGCEIWSLTLKNIGRGYLRETFGTHKTEVTREWKNNIARSFVHYTAHQIFCGWSNLERWDGETRRKQTTGSTYVYMGG